MKRFVLSLVMIGIIGMGSGCIVATSFKDNRLCGGRDVVAVNGELYVVDKYEGKVMKVNLEDAGPFEPVPEDD